MKPTNSFDDLMQDVLADATPAEFRASVLERSVHCARRRRRGQQTRRGVLSLMAVALVALAMWRGTINRQGADAPALTLQGVPYHLVQTSPLPSECMVTTEKFTHVVDPASVPGVLVLETRKGGSRYRVLNDDELLALAGNSAVGLVRIAPGEAKLIWAAEAR